MEIQEVINIILSEKNRLLEEEYAKSICKKDNIKLFFILENKAFTNGEDIIVDPTLDKLYMEKQIIKRAEEELNIDNTICDDMLKTLKVITRGFVIHESLHIVYSDFPDSVASNYRASNDVNTKTLLLIRNIIEDGYIENAGVTEYKDIEYYLKILRTSISIKNRFKSNKKKMSLIELYFEYIIMDTLYNGANYSVISEEVRRCINKTKDIILNAQIEGDSLKRAEAVYKVFDIIKILIKDDYDIDSINNLLLNNRISAKNVSLKKIYSKGKNIIVRRRLFKDLNNVEINIDSSSYDNILDDIEGECDDIIDIDYYDYIPLHKIKASDVHKGIIAIERKLKGNIRNKIIYDRIISNNKLAINNYASRCKTLLESYTEDKEDKFLFGSGINTKRLGSVDKRYWYRKNIEKNEVSTSFLLLIDGSGSMSGKKQMQSINASIILHEVLRKNKIEHAIVEARAILGAPLVEHNILIDYKYEHNQKYNLIDIKAEGGTREGLSLLWAHNYMNKYSDADNKVIIVISDGDPYHYIGEGFINYEGLLAKQDTKLAVDRIIKEKTNVVAIALEDEFESCYDSLKYIYSDVIDCKDISKLVKQLFSVITRILLR